MKKLKKNIKFMCIILMTVTLALGGFMGIDKYMPKERSLTILDNNAAYVSTSAKASSENMMKIKSKAAVLVDVNSGQVLYEKNSRKHLPPASVTKVMTLLLIMEGCDSGKINLSDKVRISQRAASMGGSQMYMEEGEEHTVEELLKGVIMASANDGCVALAEHLCGSVEDFVLKMNSRAMEMGLKDSNFVNTNGLPVANHYSCAYDIGMISKELIKYDETHKWFTKWQEDIRVGLPGKESKFTLTNTNKLIKNYSGAIGIKTGFTQDAGYCLSGAAERNNTTLIGVVLGCKTSDIRFAEMEKLLNYGFANYETIIIAERNDRIKKVKINKGEKKYLYAVPEKKIGITVAKDNSMKVKKEVEIKEKMTAPINKGDKIGHIIVTVGKNKETYELVADRKISKAGYLIIYERMMQNLT